MPAAAVRRRSPTVDGDQHRLGGLYATPVGWQIFHGFIREEPCNGSDESVVRSQAGCLLDVAGI